MQHWQLPFLGLAELPAELTEFEIRYFFTFPAKEREAIFTRRGDHHRLAVALQIGKLKMTGRPLDAFDSLPTAVLKHLSLELEIATPELASLRMLYSRHRTLYDHQTWAIQCLGFLPLTEHRQRMLGLRMREEAQQTFAIHRLVEFAKRWLYDRRMVIPADRLLRDLARRAYAHTEKALLGDCPRMSISGMLVSLRHAVRASDGRARGMPHSPWKARSCSCEGLTPSQGPSQPPESGPSSG